MNNTSSPAPFSIPAILAYHLLPGLPILLITILLTHPVWGFGLPIFLSLMLAIAVGLLPVQLGIMAVYAKRRGKKVRDIIGFTEKTPPLKTAIIVTGLLLFSILVFSFVAPIEHPLWKIFAWVPDWFRLDRFSLSAASTPMVTITLLLGFVFNGILGPFVEELYFRGFLLPRMGKLGKIAPFINTALFSLYHLFTPWENVTRIIAITPMTYAVYAKHDIRIGILTHCILNTSSMVIMTLSVLAA